MRLCKRGIVVLSGSIGLWSACGSDGNQATNDGGSDGATAACVAQKVTFNASMYQHSWDNSIAATFDGSRLLVATVRGANDTYAIEVTARDANGQQWQKPAGAAGYTNSGETPPRVALALGGGNIAVAWNQVRLDDATPRLTQVAVSQFASDGTVTMPATVQTRATFGRNSVEANEPRLGYLRSTKQFALGWSEMRVEANDTYFTYNAFAKVLGGTEARLVQNTNPGGDRDLLLAQVDAFGIDGDGLFALTYDYTTAATYNTFAMTATGAGPKSQFYKGTGGHVTSAAKVGDAVGYVKFSGVAGEAGVSVNGVPRLFNLEDDPTAAAVVATASNFVFAYQTKGDFPFRVIEIAPNGTVGRTRYTAPRVTKSSIIYSALDGNALHLVWLQDDQGMWTLTGETICLTP